MDSSCEGVSKSEMLRHALFHLGFWFVALTGKSKVRSSNLSGPPSFLFVPSLQPHVIGAEVDPSSYLGAFADSAGMPFSVCFW